MPENIVFGGVVCDGSAFWVIGDDEDDEDEGGGLVEVE